MNQDFEKILNLISKTNDKYIVNFHNKNFVVMDLKEYEKLLGIEKNEVVNNEEDLINKINNEISDWSFQHQQDGFVASKEEELQDQKKENESEDQYYLEPVD